MKREDRKKRPVFSGVLQYFPDALLELAHHSFRGNELHNPGQPLHWAREKSTDHADCIARHLVDIGPTWDAIDEETGSYHAAALAWRALALLQLVLEKAKTETYTGGSGGSTASGNSGVFTLTTNNPKAEDGLKMFQENVKKMMNENNLNRYKYTDFGPDEFRLSWGSIKPKASVKAARKAGKK